IFLGTPAEVIHPLLALLAGVLDSFTDVLGVRCNRLEDLGRPVLRGDLYGQRLGHCVPQQVMRRKSIPPYGRSAILAAGQSLHGSNYMDLIDSDLLRVILGIGIPVLAIASIALLFMLIDVVQEAKEFYQRENRRAREMEEEYID